MSPGTENYWNPEIIAFQERLNSVCVRSKLVRKGSALGTVLVLNLDGGIAWILRMPFLVTIRI